MKEDANKKVCANCRHNWCQECVVKLPLCRIYIRDPWNSTCKWFSQREYTK